MKDNTTSFIEHAYKTFNIQCGEVLTHKNKYFYIDRNTTDSSTMFIFFPNIAKTYTLKRIPTLITSINTFYRNIVSLCKHYTLFFNYTATSIVLIRNDVYVSNDSIHYTRIISIMNDDDKFHVFPIYPVEMALYE